MSPRRELLRSIVLILVTTILIETALLCAFAAFVVGVSTAWRKPDVYTTTESSLIYEHETELDRFTK